MAVKRDLGDNEGIEILIGRTTEGRVAKTRM
jgi:hypothetical protein